MKNTLSIQKLDSILLSKPIPIEIRKGAIISVVYCETEVDKINLQKFTGRCILYRKRGLNSSIWLQTTFGHISIIKSFFIYSPYNSIIVSSS